MFIRQNNVEICNNKFVFLCQNYYALNDIMLADYKMYNPVKQIREFASKFAIYLDMIIIESVRRLKLFVFATTCGV